MIKFPCPHCKCTVSAADENEDSKVICPWCKEAMEVPRPSTAKAEQTTETESIAASAPDTPNAGNDSDGQDPKRLALLIFCAVGLGWILPMIIPNRYFIGNGIEFPLFLLSVPLSVLAFLVLINPCKSTLTPKLLGLGVLATVFTATIGIFLLSTLQSHGQKQIDHFELPHHGRAGPISGMLLWMVGWLYDGAFSQDVGLFHRILGFIFGVGFCEEFVKILPVLGFLIFLREEPNPNDTGEIRLSREMVLIGVFSGLGFGLGEALVCYNPTSGNVNYSSLVTRWFGCIPLHATWTGLLALFIWIQRDDLRQASRRSAKHWEFWLLAVILTMITALAHGIYDLICQWWILAVVLNSSCILLLAQMLHDSKKEAGGPSETPHGFIKGIESVLWKNRPTTIKAAAVFIVLIFLTGFLGIPEEKFTWTVNSIILNIDDPYDLQEKYTQDEISNLRTLILRGSFNNGLHD